MDTALTTLAHNYKNVNKELSGTQMPSHPWVLFKEKTFRVRVVLNQIPQDQCYLPSLCEWDGVCVVCVLVLFRRGGGGGGGGGGYPFISPHLCIVNSLDCFIRQ